MNKTMAGGVFLTVLGIVLLILGNVEFKSQEEVFRVGNLSATATTAKTIPAFRYGGIAALSAGIVVLAFGLKSRKDRLKNQGPA